eukprot:Ihof_evm9s162 gene=Ihof_evmTU9s162
MDEKDIRALVEQAYDDVSNAMSEPLEKPKEEEEMAMRFKPKMEAWKIRAMRGELSSTLDSGVNPDDLYFGFTASNKTILRTQITDRSPVVDKLVTTSGKEEGKPSLMVKQKVVKKDTAGEQWFSIPAQELTPDVKKELQILKMRGYIDPKRHYKKDKQTGLPKYFQMGTVVAGPTEFFSSRLVNKDRHRSMVDELLADVQ